MKTAMASPTQRHRESHIGDQPYPTTDLGFGNRTVVVLLLALLFSPLVTRADERIVSGDFSDASTLSAWPIQTNFTTSDWSSDDWDGMSGGSLILTYEGGTGTSGTVAQCASVSGDELFTASARTRIQSEQAFGGYFNLYLQFYETADCSIGMSGIIAQQGLSLVPGAFDSWQLIEINDSTPLTAQSVRVNLRAFKATSRGVEPFTADVDAVSFFIDDTLIFRDGFEDGTTGAWAP